MASLDFPILLILCSFIVFGKSLMKLHSVFRNVSFLLRKSQKTVGLVMTSSQARFLEEILANLFNYLKIESTSELSEHILSLNGSSTF